MKSKPPIKSAPPVSPSESVERLIEEAMKKPGVAELFRVYEVWQTFDQVSRLNDQFNTTQYVVSASSSSGPPLHQLG